MRCPASLFNHRAFCSDSITQQSSVSLRGRRERRRAAYREEIGFPDGTKMENSSLLGRSDIRTYSSPSFPFHAEETLQRVKIIIRSSYDICSACSSPKISFTSHEDMPVSFVVNLPDILVECMCPDLFCCVYSTMQRASGGRLTCLERLRSSNFLDENLAGQYLPTR